MMAEYSPRSSPQYFGTLDLTDKEKELNERMKELKERERDMKRRESEIEEKWLKLVEEKLLRKQKEVDERQRLPEKWHDLKTDEDESVSLKKLST